MAKLYIGLLSGTSMDAVDAALVDFTDTPQLIAAHNEPFPSELKKTLWEIIEQDDITDPRIPAADQALGELFATAVKHLLAKTNYAATDILAIGSHGQNISHHPNDANPYSLQIGDAQIIANRTGITTIADFRSADVAAGGQGAPLAPLFHRIALHSTAIDRVIVNIGGIANITTLPKNADFIIGFDTGPGNGLLYAWIKKHLNVEYDQDGAWAKTGKLNDPLLQRLLSDPYFQKPAPKSTGKEYFNLQWLQPFLTDEKKEDVQRTLVELTARTISNAIQQLSTQAIEVIVCGGGVHNEFLLERLTALLTHPVKSSTALGIDPDFVEAMLFAWLGKMRLEEQECDTRQITGATKKLLLGKVFYPILMPNFRKNIIIYSPFKRPRI